MEMDHNMDKALKKRKNRIAAVIVLLIVVIIAGVGFLLRYMPWSNYEMPVVTFVYHDKANDIYLFDSKGNIYAIDRSTGKTNDFDWVNEAVASLEKGQVAQWMQIVGRTDGKELQKQYNTFCKVVKNSNFGVYATVKEIPAVEPNTQYTTPEEYWFGYYRKNGNCEWKTFFLVGYLKYKATDNRADEIAGWVKEEVSKYKINHAK